MVFLAVVIFILVVQLTYNFVIIARKILNDLDIPKGMQTMEKTVKQKE